MAITDLQNQAASTQSEINNWQGILNSGAPSASYKLHAQMMIDQLKSTLIGLQQQIAQATQDAALAAQAAAAAAAEKQKAEDYAKQQQQPEAVYTGQASSQGGTWGNTPATLAAQQVKGGVIAYTVKDSSGQQRAATTEEAQQITQKAVENLTPQQKEQYKAAVIQMSSETLNEIPATMETPSIKDLSAEMPTTIKTIQNETLKVSAEPIPQAIGLQQQKIKVTPAEDNSVIMSNESYNALSPQYKNILNNQGYNAFAKEYLKDHVKIDSNTYLLNSDWAKLSTEDQKFILDNGIKAYLKKQPDLSVGNIDITKSANQIAEEKQQQELQRNAGKEYVKSTNGTFVPSRSSSDKDEVYIATSTGEMIKKSSLDNMEDRYKQILVTGGYDAYQKALNMEYTKIPTADNKEQLIKNTDFYALPPAQQYILQQQGFEGLDKFVAEQESALSGYSYKNEDGTTTPDILLALRAGGDKEQQAVESLYTPQQIADATQGQIIKATNPMEWLYVAGESISNPIAIQQTAQKITEFAKDLPETVVKTIPQLKAVIDTAKDIGEKKGNYIKTWQEQNPEDAKKVESDRKTVEEVLNNINIGAKNVGILAGYVGETVKEAFNQSGGALSSLADDSALGQLASVAGKVVRGAGGLTSAGIDLIGVVPATLLSSAVSVGSDVALSQIGKGATKEKATQEGLATTMGLITGLGSFFMSRPQAIKQDPEFELPYTLVMAVSPEKIAKTASYLKTVVDPKVRNWEAISLNIDVGRITPSRGMSQAALVDMVNSSIRNIVKQSDGAVSEMLRTGHDAVIKDPVSGKVTAHLTGIERSAAPNIMYSSTPSKFDAIKAELNTKGEYNAKYLASEMIRKKLPGWEEALGMEFNSPHPNATFFAGSHMAGSEAGNPAIKAKIFSPSDYKDYSKHPEISKLLYEGKVNEAKETLRKLNVEGKLEAGIYPIYKWYKSPEGKPTVEFEMVDTLLYKPVQAPWWAKDKTSNTAVTYAKSPIRSFNLNDVQTAEVIGKFKDKFGTDITWNKDTGKFVVLKDSKSFKQSMELSPEQAAIKAGVEGQGVKMGQNVPIVWMISENAIKEGRTMPSLASMYKSEAMGALTELRKSSPIGGLKNKREITSDVTEGITTGQQFKSVAPVTSQSPAWAKGSRDSMIANANKLIAEGKLEKFDRQRGTALVIDKKTGKIFYTRSKGERLGSPGGGMERGETAIEALAREMEEETGLKATKAERIGLVDDPNPIISDRTGDPVFMGGKLMYNKHHAYMVLVDDVSKAKLGSDLIESKLKTVQEARKPALLHGNQLEGYSEKILEKVSDQQIKEFIEGKTGKSIAEIKKTSKPIANSQVVSIPNALLSEEPVIKQFVKKTTPLDIMRDTKATAKYADISLIKVSPTEKGLVEKVASEKIITEKIPKEKIYNEKISNEKMSTEKVPSEKLPSEKVPTEKLPSEKTPVEKLATEKTPAEKIPVEKLPSEKTPSEKVPTEKTPSEKTPVEKMPSEKTPNEKTPTEKTPSEKTPVEKMPSEKTPNEKTPTEKTPTEKTPVEKVPSEKIPHEKIPVEKIPNKPVPEKIIRIIHNASGEERKITASQLEGAIAWKQGFIYKLWYKPFGQADIVNTTEPIPGVKYFEGVGSAAKSIVALYGEIPQHIRRDMGIADIDVFRAKSGNTPLIKYKPDPKQKTKYSKTLGGIKGVK